MLRNCSTSSRGRKDAEGFKTCKEDSFKSNPQVTQSQYLHVSNSQYFEHTVY